MIAGPQNPRPGRALIAAAIAMLACALLPASAQAAPRDFFGIVPNPDLGPADLKMIRKANVGAARITFSWPLIEGKNDEFNWGFLDQQIGDLATRGIRALPNVFGTPGWLSKNPTKPPLGSARQKRQWQGFLRKAVKRYGKGGTYWRSEFRGEHADRRAVPVKIWQIWNEQNGPKHFAPKPNVRKYSELLRISKQAINKEDRRADMLLGGMASEPTGKGGIDAWRYIEKLLSRKRVKRSFDAVALHPYARNDGEIGSDVKKVRGALKKGGKKKAETWVTEVGWSSNPKVGGKLAKTPKQQASLLKRTFKLLKGKRRAWRIGGVYWYTWRDGQGGVCDWCSTAGLVEQDLDPKPAYKKYKRVAG